MHISYEYDPLGRLISENAADLQGDPTQFGLDFIQGPDPISGVEHPDAPEREFDRTYRYDAAGNRTARITDYTGSADDEYVEYMYAVDVPGSDQLSEVRMYAGLDSNAPHVRTECYDYDANGFMIQKRVDEDTDVNPDDEWVHDYTPDVEGRLASYDRTDLDGSNDISGHVFDYNESGVRVRSGSRHFLVAMQNHTGYAQVLLERSGGAQSAPTRHYAIGDDALGQETALGGLQALLADGHGSTRQLYSGSSSGNNEYYDYDAYGEAFGWELDVPDSSVPRPGTDLLYAGEQWDADLGMQYLRARYYLPGQGVFNRVDPFFGNMDDPQSLHKYAYVHGDPVNRIDPSGTVSITSLSVTMGLSMSIVGVLFLSLGEDPYEDLVRGLLAGARLGAGIAFAINKIFAVAIGVFAAFIQVVIDLISAVESTTGMFLNSLEAFAEGIFDAAVDQFLAVSSLGKATGGVQLLIDLLSELMGQFAAFRDWAATPVRQFSRAMISFVITTAFAAGSQVWPGAVSRRLTSLVASINPINYGSSGANYSDGVADRLADSRFFVDNIEPAISQFFARVGTSLADLF